MPESPKAVRSEDILPDDVAHAPSGAKGIAHRKGTTSACFLNAEIVLTGGINAEACERRLRAQVYDIVSANGVGELFEWTEPRLAAIVEDELRCWSHEPYAADPSTLRGGFTGDDFLPGSDNHGTVASGDVDPLLKAHQVRQVGVRKGTFGAFVANYRLARSDANNIHARQTMAEYLFPGIMQLGYFDWWKCKDDWAQEMVESARDRWEAQKAATFERDDTKKRRLD